MSYCLTDAGEQDMRAELAVLETLNDEVDQLSATARDCDTICPEAKSLLDLAWYFTEKAMREAHGCCSAGCNGKGYCACCRHFEELHAKASRLNGILGRRSCTTL